jgi:hypothetical protein
LVGENFWDFITITSQTVTDLTAPLQTVAATVPQENKNNESREVVLEFPQTSATNCAK